MDLYLFPHIHAAVEKALDHNLVLFSNQETAVFSRPTPGLYHSSKAFRRRIKGWVEHLTPYERIMITEFGPLSNPIANRVVEVIEFLEAHAPCDDTVVIALRSGLVPKITFTKE